MGLIYDMEVRKDVKGGGPPTPTHSTRLEKLESELEKLGSESDDNSVGSVWRVIAMCAASALLSGVAAVFTLGTNNVKQRDIDAIMAARSPYAYDKQRIEEHFKTLESGQKDLYNRLDKLETIARDDFDKRIRELETQKNGR